MIRELQPWEWDFSFLFRLVREISKNLGGIDRIIIIKQLIEIPHPKEQESIWIVRDIQNTAACPAIAFLLPSLSFLKTNEVRTSVSNLSIFLKNCDSYITSCICSSISEQLPDPGKLLKSIGTRNGSQNTAIKRGYHDIGQHCCLS